MLDLSIAMSRIIYNRVYNIDAWNINFGKTATIIKRMMHLNLRIRNNVNDNDLEAAHAEYNDETFN